MKNNSNNSSYYALRCVECGCFSKMGKWELFHTYKNDTIKIKVEGEKCLTCNEITMDGKNCDIYLKALHEQKKRVNKLT